MRAVWRIAHQAAAMERSCCANAFRNCASGAHDERATHAVSHCANFAGGINAGLLVEKGDIVARIGHARVLG